MCYISLSFHYFYFGFLLIVTDITDTESFMKKGNKYSEFYFPRKGQSLKTDRQENPDYQQGLARCTSV
jgi:hypothetical protein